MTVNKVIVAGSRGIYNYNVVANAINESKFKIDELVCGGAQGVDLLGKKYAEKHGIPVKMFPADWDTHGKAAGYLRNKEMAEYATHLIAIWDGESRGTKMMIDLAKKNFLLCHIVIV